MWKTRKCAKLRTASLVRSVFFLVISHRIMKSYPENINIGLWGGGSIVCDWDRAITNNILFYLRILCYICYFTQVKNTILAQKIHVIYYFVEKPYILYCCRVVVRGLLYFWAKRCLKANTWRKFLICLPCPTFDCLFCKLRLFSC